MEPPEQRFTQNITSIISIKLDLKDRHVGDLGNIAVSEEEIAFVRIEDHLVKLSGETSVVGRAIVVHEGREVILFIWNLFFEGTDDLGLGGEEDSLTTGHAGARAGCCVITQIEE